jgi:hypothetical protein
MSEKSELAVPEETRQRLEQLWAQAAVVQEPPSELSTGQFLARGRNIRLNLLSAITAAFETAHAAVAGAKVWVNPYDFMAWLEAAGESINAVRSVLEALVQQMQPIDYVTAVILSRRPEGMTPETLQNEVVAFLNGPRSDEYAWYLGMSKDRMRRAREVITSDDWFNRTESSLRNDGFIDEVGGKLLFHSQNFTWGWKLA